jgi:hypothetical protein
MVVRGARMPLVHKGRVNGCLNEISKNGKLRACVSCLPARKGAGFHMQPTRGLHSGTNNVIVGKYERVCKLRGIYRSLNVYGYIVNEILQTAGTRLFLARYASAKAAFVTSTFAP